MSKADQLRAMREANSSSGSTESRRADKRHGGHTRQPQVGTDDGLGVMQTIPRSKVGVATDPLDSKQGRPLAKDAPYSFERTKPWEAEGMSRRTWYRRKHADKRSS